MFPGGRLEHRSHPAVEGVSPHAGAPIVAHPAILALILHGCATPTAPPAPTCDPTLALLRDAAGEKVDPACLPRRAEGTELDPPEVGSAPAPFTYPAPLADLGAGELVERGHAAYRADRLREALVAYHQALDLDRDCAICQRRIDRILAELDQRVQVSLATGQRYWGELRYAEATLAWERVLELQPDPAHPAHQQAQRYLDTLAGGGS